MVEFIEDSWSKFHGRKTFSRCSVCAREFRPVLNELHKTRPGNWKRPDSGVNWPKLAPPVTSRQKPGSTLYPDVETGEIIAPGLNLSKLIENPANWSILSGD